MTSKTISLTGAEIRADYSGGTNAWLRNDGTTTVYASTAPGVTAGADGTVSIPAGQAAAIYGACGAVYLLGTTGSVQLVGSDYTACPFKTSTSAGGESGVDEVARAAIEAHAADADIHVTATEKAAWNAVNYSNPNLLINPDFRINQRGITEYSQPGYGYDRWYLGRNTGTVKAENGKCTITCTDISDTQHIIQFLEGSYAGKNLVFSLNIEAIENCKAIIRIADEKFSDLSPTAHVTTTVSGKITCSTTVPNSFTGTIRVIIGFYKADTVGGYFTFSEPKLEIGTVATPFTPPDPATELLRCQRYYQVRTTNDIDPLDLRPSMRTITDIKAVEGGYAYVAEL